ncbi:hypothetical protein GQ44DRAFT_770341 [Phaeosphaeriaceae sp. PMI808]|nr:hypothetical protein GQ44DRAFT_770341 [Phaeosphaeriaceae sp. PMI808]
MTNPAQELQWAGAPVQQRTHTPLHTLPLPPLQFGRFYAEIAQIIVESTQWNPESYIGAYGGLSIEGNVREHYSIERQRVMALLKRHQHAGTPKIHAYLSCDNYFFGTLRCQVVDVQRTGEAKSECFKLHDLDVVETHRQEKPYTLYCTEKIITDMHEKGWLIKGRNYEQWFRFFPTLSLRVELGGRAVELIVFLVRIMGTGEIVLACHGMPFAGLHDLVSAPLYMEQLPLLRKAGIHDSALEQQWRASVGPPGYSARSPLSTEYIHNVCHWCTFRYRSSLTDYFENGERGTTSGGSAWCTHYAYREFPDPLSTRIERIAKIAGSPARFSLWFLKFRGVLGRKKVKLFTVTVELGGALGDGATHFASLAEYNAASRQQNSLIDFFKPLPASSTGAPPDLQLSDPLNPLIPKGKALKSVSKPLQGYAFATDSCTHTLPQNWTRQPFAPFPNVVYEKHPTYDVRECRTFLPPAARIVSSVKEIQAAAADGYIPVIFSQGMWDPIPLAMVQVAGGYAYVMRECIHCAVVRAQRLAQSAGLVAIVCGALYKNGLDDAAPY